jgi:hypothetical protein
MSGPAWSRSRSRSDARDARSPVHCHCIVVEIAPEMRQECKKAWAECQKAQEEASTEKTETKNVKWESSKKK